MARRRLHIQMLVEYDRDLARAANQAANEERVAWDVVTEAKAEHARCVEAEEQASKRAANAAVAVTTATDDRVAKSATVASKEASVATARSKDPDGDEKKQAEHKLEVDAAVAAHQRAVHELSVADTELAMAQEQEHKAAEEKTAAVAKTEAALANIDKAEAAKVEVEKSAIQSAVDSVKAEWAPKWQIWKSSCEVHDPGGTEGLDDKIKAIHDKYAE